ncbi:hypothetical protein QFZ53_002816 [Microbacterium natoriense]|uniref:Lipoprotein n=1 Tax=Microbacterium natoriense TaxID=284570 RepID=A0AAW8F0V2_9MICO|nr:hypothetical protein [Microbacterium natoriense]MDQ0648620.1 hypothetical protein [Microbacterium natoriense]
MKKKKINNVAACLVLATIALTSCSYPGEDPGEAAPAPPSATTAPKAQDEISDKDEDIEPSNDDKAVESDKPVADEIDLASEDGVQYLHAIQAFSPLLESWVVDQDGESLSYMRYNCVGRLDDGGTGAIAPYKGDKWQVTWDGDSPLRLTSGATERLAITDRSLSLGTESATVSTEIELEKFVGMCKDAGETVAGFVLD